MTRNEEYPPLETFLKMEESYCYRSFFKCAGDQRTLFCMLNKLIELIIGSKFTSGLKPSEELFAAIRLDSVHRDVIFLALSHPAHNMIRTLERLGVDTNKLQFIDAITKRIGSKTSVDGCVYLHSRDYNEALKAIEKKVQGKGIQDNVLFVDALHHLLLQDDSKTAMNFLDFFHKRLKVLRLSSIFLVDLERLHPDVRSKLESISDKTINL